MTEIPEEAQLTETPYDADLTKWAKKQLEGDRTAPGVIVGFMNKREGYFRGVANTLASPAVTGLVEAVEYVCEQNPFRVQKLRAALATFKAFKGE